MNLDALIFTAIVHVMASLMKGWSTSQAIIGSIAISLTLFTIPRLIPRNWAHRGRLNEKAGLTWTLERLPEPQQIAVQEEDDARLPGGPAVAVIKGRLARIDTIPDKQEVFCWVISEDEGYLDDYGEPRQGLYQSIRIKAELSKLSSLMSEYPMVTAVCIFHRGILTLDYLEDVRDCDDELPNARLPKRDIQGNSADGHLVPLDSLNKLGEGGFQSLNHSVYRIPVVFHITCCPKYRAKSFEGRAVEIQTILRYVSEQEGMKVIAVAAETDHIHLLLKGMTPKTCWSEWMANFKARTSARIKKLEGLEGFRWQVGYSISTVNGGKQTMDAALRAVEGYILAQGVQSPEPREEGDDD